MPLDPSISLQNQPNVPLITPQQLMGLKSALLQNQQAELQIAQLTQAKNAQDAVNGELRTPGASDQFGLTDMGMKDLASKGYGMEALKMRTERTKAQAQQTQLDYTLSLIGEADLKRVGEVAKIQGDAVTSAINADIGLPEGSTETARQDAGQKALDDFRDRLKASGANPKVLESLPTKYDPQKFRRSQEGFDAVRTAADRIMAEKTKKATLEHTEAGTKNFEDEERHRKVAERQKEEEIELRRKAQGMGLTGDPTQDMAIEAAGTAYNLTGKLPPNTGRGGLFSQAALRYAAKDWQDRGLTPEQRPAKQAEFAGLQKAQGNLQQYAARVDIAADTFHENIPIALQALTDLGNTNSRALNAPLNEIRKYTTDENLIAAVGALGTAGREYERVVIGASSNAQLPVAAQEHAQQLANPNMTIKEALKLFKVLDQDAANVKKAIDHGLELNEWKMENVLPPKKGEFRRPKPELDQPAAFKPASGPAAFPGAKQIGNQWYFPNPKSKTGWSTEPPEMT